MASLRLSTGCCAAAVDRAMVSPDSGRSCAIASASSTTLPRTSSICKASLDTIRDALDDNYRTEHVFSLRQALSLYKFHHVKVVECDVDIEAALRELNDNRETPTVPMLKVRHAHGRNEPKFDVRDCLCTFLSADLS